MSDVRRHGSGGPFEELVGYSRVVRAGDFVFVSGCTSVADGEVVHAGEPAAQTRQAIENVRTALARVGGTLADVVRTRMFVTDIARWEEYGRAHGEAFGEIRPASTMVEVSALIDPTDAGRDRGRRLSPCGRRMTVTACAPDRTASASPCA